MHRCDLIMHRCDLIMHRCDLIMHRCDLIMHKCDLIMHRCDLIMHRCDLIMYTFVSYSYRAPNIQTPWETWISAHTKSAFITALENKKPKKIIRYKKKSVSNYK